MDYKDKYIKALNEATTAYKDEDKHLKATLERIFPELKESEGERIRKELLEHCKNQAEPYIQTGNECPQIQSWIAWLEKQGEQKPVEWSEEDENGLGDALWAIKQAGTIAKDENDMGTLWYAEKWLNTIKEKVVG